MFTVTNTVEIKASSNDVWAVLADLPATRHWLPGTLDARMDQDVRVCRMTDGQDIHERIFDLDPARRSYSFEHLRVALPVKKLAGTFTVVAGPDPAQATVTLTTTFEPLDPNSGDQLTGMIQVAFGQSLESLRRYVEDHTSWDQT